MRKHPLVEQETLERKIRPMIRNAYVYGYLSREDVAKSHRLTLHSQYKYDKMIGYWMNGLQRKVSRGGSNGVYIRIAGSEIGSNPLFRVFHASAIDPRFPTVYFFLTDFLRDGARSQSELFSLLTDATNALRKEADKDAVSEDTLGAYLRQFIALGVLEIDENGLYRLADTPPLPPTEALQFASEQLPLGVVGSYLLQHKNEPTEALRFKHHYLLGALDSLILCDLVGAAEAKRYVTVVSSGREPVSLIPFRFYFGTQTGRQYVLGCDPNTRKPLMLRLDLIERVLPCDATGTVDEAAMQAFASHLWNVSAGPNDALPTVKHLEMTLRIEDGEEYLLTRLQREKKHGTLTRIAPNEWRFSIDVCDPLEMTPWILTFTGRITGLRCPSDPLVEQRFSQHIHALLTQYGVNDDAE